MKASIVIIGDEILLGRVADTNSGMISRALASRGWDVCTVVTVGDNAADIRGAIGQSLRHSDLVISTGGLGPTRDDITKGVLLDIFGGTLVQDRDVVRNVERIFAGRGLAMNALTLGQAMVPDSCRVIENRYGTAPIMWFERAGHVFVAMPGVPFETRGMLPEVISSVERHFGTAQLAIHREYTVAGISESSLAERLAPFEDSLPGGYKLAYLPVAGQITLRLDSPHGTAADSFEAVSSALTVALGPYLAGIGNVSPAQRLLSALRRHRLTMATAESCTGGNVAHCITSVAGCSDVFRGGVVSYANEIKTGILGVDADILARHGAVSREVVRQMAAGACRICGADCAVATSGIAGPGGGAPDKPTGTVWIAAHTPAAATEQIFHFPGDRQAVIDRASAEALKMLAALIENHL